VGLGVIGDFRDVLEAKLSVETEFSLEDESDRLLDGPGLKINLVGTIFLTAGDKGGFTNDSEGVLVFTVGDFGDCGVLIFAARDVDAFTIGDDGAFTLDDSGVLTVGDDGTFTTANGFVLATGDFGTKFLATEVALAFNVVVFDTAVVVDFIVEEDFTDSNDKELDSFLTIAFEEVGFGLETTLDLLVDFKEDIFAELGGSLVNNFEGEVGAFKEIDFMLDAVDRLFAIIGGLFVGIVGLLTPAALLTDDIADFLTTTGFATVAWSFDFNDVALTLTVADAAARAD